MYYKAYAKINLCLDILRERADGYHDIDTVFQKIDLYDEIHIEKSEFTEILSDDSNFPDLKDNLMYKSQILLEDYSGKKLPFRARVKKNIPIAAGLAGGSTDAATTLMALNEIYDLRFSKEILIDIGKNLGADIPFFLSGYSSARGGGIGDILNLSDIPKDFRALIVKPDFSVFSHEVYNSIFPEEYGKIDIKGIEEAFKNKNSYRGNFNIMEGYVFKKHPILKSIKEALYDIGADYAFMSGSGSSMVGIFDNGTIDAEIINDTFKNLWVKVVNFI